MRAEYNSGTNPHVCYENYQQVVRLGLYGKLQSVFLRLLAAESPTGSIKR
jgi:hypothetical protein